MVGKKKNGSYRIARAENPIMLKKDPVAAYRDALDKTPSLPLREFLASWINTKLYVTSLAEPGIPEDYPWALSEELFKEAMAGNLEATRSLLRRGADMNARNDFERTKKGAFRLPDLFTFKKNHLQEEVLERGLEPPRVTPLDP